MNTRTKICRIVKYACFLMMGLMLCQNLLANDTDRFDYEKWPEQQVAFQHMELEIIWDGVDGISGNVAYTITPFFDDPEEVMLHAPGHQIEGVYLNNESVETTHENGELRIPLTNHALQSGNSYTLSVRYETVPTFGFFYGAGDMAITSLLPKSIRHWLPVYDHPRTRLTFDWEIRVPSGYVVAASGNKTGERGGGDGRSVTRWQSETPVSVTNLAWAAGPFVTEEARTGFKQVRLLAPREVSVETRMSLLDEAIRQIRSSEQFLNLEFPSDVLHLVVIDDDYWETRFFGNSYGIIPNHPEFYKEYISRIVAGQWFGVRLQTESWKDAEALALLQQWLAREIDAEYSITSPYHKSDLADAFSFYDVYSPYRSARYSGDAHDKLLVTVSSTGMEIARNTSGMTDWSGIAETWYEHSGLSLREPVVPNRIESKDTLRYLVKVETDAVNNRVIIHTDPDNSAADQDFTFVVTVGTSQGQREFELTSSGEGERLLIPVEGRVQYVAVDDPEDSPVTFWQEKSMTLWLNQLRAEELDMELRVRAAKGMRWFSDSDLQLALRDVLNRVEDSPELTAEIYRTLGEVTAGAAGVQRLFLDGLESEHREIRIASLESLVHYPDDQRIEDEVFNIISVSEDIEFVNRAIPVYGQLIDQEEYRDFLRQFLREDVDLEFTSTLINEIYKLDDKAYAIEHTDAYVSERYPFSLRFQTLMLLVEHDGDEDVWDTRFERLINDPDPRMRYLIASLIREKGDVTLVEQRMDSEYDERVWRELTK